jgi:hypothetical protein
VREAGSAGQPRRPALLAAAHACAGFAGIVEQLQADSTVSGDLTNIVVEVPAAVRRAGTLQRWRHLHRRKANK